MTALVRSELLKLRTTRSSLAYPLAIVVLVGIAVAGHVGSARDSERASPGFLSDVVADAAFAGLIVLIVGVVAATNEFRHGTITPTLLVTPARERLVAAKTIASTAWGIALGLLAVAIVFAVGLPWLEGVGAPYDLDGDIARAAARIVVLAALSAALGAVVGMAVQSQVGAIVGALLWLLVGEPLLTALLPAIDADAVARYLPGAALDDLSPSPTGEDPLPFAAGLAVSLAYIGAIGVLAAARTARRDIT